MKLCERACEVFGQTEISLASISVSHLYNLRKSIPYTRLRASRRKTDPGPPASLNAANPDLMASQTISASIRCTKGI
jgi:hypothetical protein